MLSSIPLKESIEQVFSPYFDFTASIYLKPFLTEHTCTASLSSVHSTIKFVIPKDKDVSQIQLSVQPLSGHEASICVNDTSIPLASTLAPYWEIITFDNTKKEKSITIKIDEKNSSTDAAVLVGNITFYSD